MPQPFLVHSGSMGSVQLLGTRQPGIYAGSNFPQNLEMQWRHTARARGLTFELFRPCCCPYVSGFTVTTTHTMGRASARPWKREAPVTLGIDAKPDAPRDCCGDDDVPPRVRMLLADQDEDRQFRNPGGPQVCGLSSSAEDDSARRSKCRIELPGFPF